MKKIMPLFLLILMISAASCKKDSNTPSVSGTWEIRRTVGMFPTILYNSGNDTLIVFSKGSYQKFEAGQLSESGTYRTEKRRQDNRITFRNSADNTEYEWFYSRRGNELNLFSDPEMADGGGSTYEKIR